MKSSLNFQLVITGPGWLEISLLNASRVSILVGSWQHCQLCRLSGTQIKYQNTFRISPLSRVSLEHSTWTELAQGKDIEPSMRCHQKTGCAGGFVIPRSFDLNAYRLLLPGMPQTLRFASWQTESDAGICVTAGRVV